MSVRVEGSLWRFRRNVVRRSLGADLGAGFALQCRQMKRTVALQVTLEEFICGRAKPALWGCTYVPDDSFRFVGDSLLLDGIYLRHKVGREHNLCMDEVAWNNGTPRSLVIRYRFREPNGEENIRANDWLCIAFGHWVDFMYTQLLMQGKAG